MERCALTNRNYVDFYKLEIFLKEIGEINITCKNQRYIIVVTHVVVKRTNQHIFKMDTFFIESGDFARKMLK